MIVRVQGPVEKSQKIYYEFDNASQPLGSGGMGVIYRGVCKSEVSGASVPVAIKQIRDGLSSDILQRAIQEASIQIDDPHLMRMWGFIQKQTWNPLMKANTIANYEVMEYIEGVNLEAILEGKTCTNDGIVVQMAVNLSNLYKKDRVQAIKFIMGQILEGVGVLHSNGYVHRDLDPSNVMLTSQDQIKVIDFGICKNIHGGTPIAVDATHYGTIMGKMEYVAPEQALGNTTIQNKTTDIYSLGIILFQLYTGHVPFSGEQEFVQKCQINTPVPVEEIDNLSIREIVKRATQKDQSGRYQSVEEMKEAIEHIVVDTPLPPPSVPAWVWIFLGISSIVVFIIALLLQI